MDNSIDAFHAVFNREKTGKETTWNVAGYNDHGRRKHHIKSITDRGAFLREEMIKMAARSIAINKSRVTA